MRLRAKQIFCRGLASTLSQCIPKLAAPERGVYAALMSLFSQPSLNSNLVGSVTLKRPDRRSAEAALWRAAKAEGRAPMNRQLLDASTQSSPSSPFP